jgi:hypothetical protein
MRRNDFRVKLGNLGRKKPHVRSSRARREESLWNRPEIRPNAPNLSQLEVHDEVRRAPVELPEQ